MSANASFVWGVSKPTTKRPVTSRESGHHSLTATYSVACMRGIWTATQITVLELITRPSRCGCSLLCHVFGNDVPRSLVCAQHVMGSAVTGDLGAIIYDHECGHWGTTTLYNEAQAFRG